MAFPSVGAPTASQQATNGTTSNVTLPASIAAGDLIVAVIGADSGAGAMTWPAPWVKLAERLDTAHVMSVGYLVASGGETSVAVTHTTERSNHLAWRITGWHGTTPPEVSALANGNSNAPNSGAVTPSWGADDTLWMSLATWDDSSVPTLSTYPTSYDLAQANNVTATSAARVAGAARQLNAASEDPGAFGLSGAETWVAYTVAVRPAAAVGQITGTATFTQAAASWVASAGEKFAATGTFAQAAAAWSGAASEKYPSTASFAQAAASWDASASEKFAATAGFTQAAPIWSAAASVPAQANVATATFAQAAASWAASATDSNPASASFTQAAASWSASLTQTSAVPTVAGTALCSITLLHTATATVGSSHTATASLSVTASASATVG